MTIHDSLQYCVFLLAIVLSVKPLGRYLDRVFARERTPLDRVLVPCERLIYGITRIDAGREMDWREYGTAFVVFSCVGTLLLYAILRLQVFLPYYFPQYLPTHMTPDLAFNTAVSFATTTTWQAYGGESTMTYVSQMVGLAVQNFLAGASGLAIGMAFIRGFARQHAHSLGNFWVDLTRALLWVLLPAAIVVSLLLVLQGVPMNWHPYTIAKTVEGGRQVLAEGPVAALESIKNLGTNGGGFFNANAAHPYENPTPISNLINALSIVLIPAALTHTFGRMVRNTRQGWMLFGVMLVLFAAGIGVCHWAEQSGNPMLHGGDQRFSAAQAGGNMEGKEVRFGIAQSVLTAVTTSNGATGSYNAMHDSFMPLGGLALLVNMLLGELSFGGLGTGIYSILMVLLVAVFVSGLMVGRTPEYLGKKITPYANKMIMLFMLASPFVILLFTATAVLTKAGLAGLVTNQGAHGLTSILFAYTSSFANNGQNFAGLNANTLFYNMTTAVAMLIGRFFLAIPALALAGEFAAQGAVSTSHGTLKTNSFAFGVTLLASILALAGLSYFPALTLGPILEHLQITSYSLPCWLMLFMC